MTIDEMKAQEQTRELARDVITMLDAQKQYFKTRERFDLQTSKTLERALRLKAEKILNQTAQQTLREDPA